jgi:hypothetical protein
MAKEHRFWQAERRTFAERLATMQRQEAAAAAGSAPGAGGGAGSVAARAADLDGQIKQVSASTHIVPRGLCHMRTVSRSRL